MGVGSWPSVTLKGDGGQVIPRACPGCMAPGTVEHRYGYRSLYYIISRTTYYQTFYYCDACSKTVDAFYKARGAIGCLGIVLGGHAFIGVMILMVALTKEGAPLEWMKGSGKTDPVVILGTTLGLAAGVALHQGLLWLHRKIGRSRRPPHAGQTGWGPAVFYVGTAGAGLSLDAHLYRALRPEWIKALVEANPGKVDDATYRQWVGAAKPAPAPQKPFAS